MADHFLAIIIAATTAIAIKTTIDNTNTPLHPAHSTVMP
jgi:hypothetical protein